MSHQGPSNYGGWSVARLKEELASRGATLRGKKKELVERLEAYDRNANFGNTDYAEEEEQLMPWTSLPMTYPTSAFKCPPVNNDCIYDYFAGEGAKVHPSAHMMYKEGSLVSFLCAQEANRTFIRCAIKSEMTKRVKYCVLLVALSTGAVEAANCECTAGSGTKATCKHVAVVMYGLECLSRTGKMNVESTCTDVAQVWHQPKKVATGSPLKASCLVYKQSQKLSTKSGENSGSSGTDIVEGEHERIMNLIYNFQATQDKPLILSLSTGQLANVPAYVHDHSYLEAPLGVAIAHNKTTVSGAEASELEAATRQQATSSRWIKERRVRLTASRFGEVMCMRPSTDGSRLAKDIVRPRNLNVPAVKWGKEMETLIRRQYEVETDVTVARSGLVVDTERPYLACSPDGVLPDRVVELKGIFSKKGEMICAESADWLERDAAGHLGLKAHSKYWYQVQGQMAIVGRELCDLVVFTDVDVRVMQVAIEPNFYIQTMVPKLRAFYDSYIVPELMKTLGR